MQAFESHKKIGDTGEGKEHLSKNVKSSPEESRGPPEFVRLGTKQEKKTLRSTFEESSKHIKGLFKSIQRKKLE